MIQHAALAIAIAIGVLAACAVASSHAAQPPAKPAALAQTAASNPHAPARLPVAGQRLLDDAATCLHFAGEIGGDQSARDREVQATMTELGCATVPARLKAWRQALPPASAWRRKIDALLADF
jgi:hypothetical protein